MRSTDCSPPKTSESMGVRTAPGLTAFTRIPYLPYSMAAVLARSGGVAERVVEAPESLERVGH
jgi:hypothetical protein